MHFAVLPPEVNSGRMYAGPGAGSMLAAAAAWDELANELHTTATNVESVVSELAGEPWRGPSSASMAAAAAPQVEWLTATAAQAVQAGTQARAAAAAYEAAHAMTVPPSVVAANRARLASLIATNVLGQNTPAIAATEVAYVEMWAQDVMAMYGYAGASHAASQVSPFTPPRRTTNPAGLAAQSAAAAQAAGTSAGTAQTALANSNAMAAVPNALQALTSAAPISTGLAAGLADFTNPYDLASLGSGLLGNSFGLIGLSGAAGFISDAEHKVVGPVKGSDAASPPKASAPRAPQGAAAPGPSRLPEKAAAVSAEMGRGASLGGLSVPEGWTAAAPEARLVALDSPGAGAVPAGPSGSSLFGEVPLFGGAPLMAMSGRGASGSRDSRPGTEAGVAGLRARPASAARDRATEPREVSGGRPSGTAAEVREVTELLGRLAELRANGTLTDKEFTEQKQRLLGGS